MMIHATRRALTVVLSVVALTCAVVVVGLPLLRGKSACDNCGDWVPNPAFTGEHNEALTYLQNVLRKKADWDMDDVRRLREYAALEPPLMKPQAGAPMSEIMAYNSMIDRQGSATASAAEKLRRSVRLTPEVRVALAEMLLDQLGRDNPKIRMGAVSSVVYARLVVDPAVRSRLERMSETETDRGVADNIRRQLAHFDTVERLRAEGKYVEPPPFDRPEK